MNLKPAALAAVLALCAGPAFAQLDPLTQPLPRELTRQMDSRIDRLEQTVRELRAIIFQGRDTNRPVVVQPVEAEGQLEAMAGRVNDLEETLRNLNRTLDTLTSDLSALRRENAGATERARLSANADAAMAARLEALERRLDTMAAAAVAAQRPPEPTEDPARDFDTALQLYINGQDRAAATAFERYLQAYGRRADAPEAYYYLGQSKFRQRDFEGASLAYISAIQDWPTTTWAPDAVVRLAQSLIELRKQPDACQILGEFATRYPRASAELKTAAATARTRARCG